MHWTSGLGRLALPALLASSFTATSVALETKLEDRSTGFIEASAGDLKVLAEELFLDYLCLVEANPLKKTLKLGELITCPLTCCKHSCKGPFCSKRPECKGQTTTTASLCTLTSTGSVVITNTNSPLTPTFSSVASLSGSFATVSTSLKTSVKTTSSTNTGTLSTSITSSSTRSTATSSQSVSTSGSVSKSSSQSASSTSTTSTGTRSSGTGSLSSSSSISSSSITTSGTTVSTSSSTTSVSTPGSTVITTTDTSGVPVTLTLPSITGPTTLTTNGQTLTLGTSTNTASNVQTLTEPDGSSITLTLGAGSSITGLTTLTTDGSTLTVGPAPTSSSAISSSVIETLTEPDGSSITLTLPPGSSITGLTTIVTDGSTLTVGPAPTSSPAPSSSIVETLTEPDGSSVTLTLPPGSSITGLTTITTDGSTLTVGPVPTTSSSGSSNVVETLTEPDGSTIILTLPSGSSITGLETITTDGSTLTVGPEPTSNAGSNVETLTEPDGSSITLTLPSGSTITGLQTITTDGSTLTVGPAPTSGATAPTTPGTGAGSATAATESPIITPPPAGGQGSIPDTIPASGPPESEIAITFNGDTYVLPHTISVELLQTDGSNVTLFSDSVVSGTATVSVPAAAVQTSLSSGGLSLEVGPEPLGSPASGGATGFTGLLNALEGLAGTANAAVNTLDQIGDQGALWAAGSLSDSAFSSAVGGLFDSASADLSNFVSSMSATFDDFNPEIYEMTEDGLRRIFPARTGGVEEFDLINSLRKLTRSLTNLRNDVIVKVKDYWVQGTAAAAALAAAEESLRNFGSYNWGGEKPTTSTSTSTNSTATATATGSSSSSSSSGTATPTPYMFTTNTGTDPSVFQSYIKTLPDGGAGGQIVFPNVPWQSYVTNLTSDQAKDVASQSFVRFVTLITENDVGTFGAIPPPEKLQKRVAPNLNLQQRPNSEEHLKVVSTANQQTLYPPGAALPDYLFDPLLGQGQTIYVLDSGFNTAHSELAANGRTVTTHVVPNQYTLLLQPNGQSPEDITDYSGHGTAVASIAGGVTLGVASKADLVLIKFRNTFLAPSGNRVYPGMNEATIQYSWSYIINDVLQKRINGYTGKSIINMSYGFKPLAGAPGQLGSVMPQIMQSLLDSCWQNDIITVVAAGNSGASESLDVRTPQSYGTAANGLITVGGVNRDGVLDTITTYDAGRGGSMSLYAVSHQVVQADASSNTGTKVADGTSFAAPAVAGVAAYFASLPGLAGNWRTNTVATDMKAYLARYAYVRSANPVQNLPNGYPAPAAGSIIVAYNRAPDGLCSDTAPSKRSLVMAKRRHVAKRLAGPDTNVVTSGTILVPNLSTSYCTLGTTTTSTSTNAPITTDQTIAPQPTTTTSPTAPITSPPITSTSSSIDTAFPTLPPATYCTEILSNGQEVLHTKTGTGSCTYNTVEPTTTTTTPAPAPTINTDDGILTCGTRTDQGNGQYFFTLGDADHARDQFCSNMTTNATPIIFAPGGNTYKLGTYVAPDNVNYPITVSAKWGTLGSDSGCPTLDMSQNDDGVAYKLCQDRLNNAINDCDTTQLNGNEFWKQGGTFFRDCITWTITQTGS